MSPKNGRHAAPRKPASRRSGVNDRLHRERVVARRRPRPDVVRAESAAVPTTGRLPFDAGHGVRLLSVLKNGRVLSFLNWKR